MVGLNEDDEAGIDAINAALITLRQTLDRISVQPFRGAAPSVLEAQPHRHAHQIGHALGIELLQNPGAMNLDGARTAPEPALNLAPRAGIGSSRIKSRCRAQRSS